MINHEVGRKTVSYSNVVSCLKIIIRLLLNKYIYGVGLYSWSKFHIWKHNNLEINIRAIINDETECSSQTQCIVERITESWKNSLVS